MLSSSDLTRASLILRLRNPRDLSAWDQFAEMYGRVLYRVARGRGFQAADAENLVQEVLIAVAQSVEQWLERPDRGRFRVWLLRIARNEAVNLLTRRATRSLGVDGEAAAQTLEALAAPDQVSSQLELEYGRAVFQWAARQVREQVSDTTWQAFWLTHVDGLTIDEAARRLQTRPATIYIGRSRVMARIRESVRHFEERT